MTFLGTFAKSQTSLNAPRSVNAGFLPQLRGQTAVIINNFRWQFLLKQTMPDMACKVKYVIRGINAQRFLAEGKRLPLLSRSIFGITQQEKHSSFFAGGSRQRGQGWVWMRCGEKDKLSEDVCQGNWRLAQARHKNCPRLRRNDPLVTDQLTASRDKLTHWPENLGARSPLCRCAGASQSAKVLKTERDATKVVAAVRRRRCGWVGPATPVVITLNFSRAVLIWSAASDRNRYFTSCVTALRLPPGARLRLMCANSSSRLVFSSERHKAVGFE